MTSNTSLTIRSTGRAAMASFIAALALILPTACDMFGMGGDLTPPNNVVSLAASPGDRFVTLTWIDPGDSDLESVEISQTPGGLAKLLVGAGAQTATVAGLTNGSAYTFTVQTVDEAGNRSGGVIVPGTPVGSGDTIIPGAVANLASVPGNRQVVLTWSDPADADLAYLQITHDQDGGSLPRNVAKGLQGATIGQLTNGTACTFTVRAVDASGNRSNGRATTATPSATIDSTAPGEVSGLGATAGDGCVTLVWTDPNSPDLHHMEITHDQMGGADPVYVAKGAQGVMITGLANSAHQFTVKTVDASGNLSAGSSIPATPSAIAGDVTPPAEVTGLDAAAGLGEVTISWTDPEDVDFGFVGITHDQAGGATSRIVMAGVQSATVTGLAAGTEYVFTVTTYDDSGNPSAGLSSLGVIPLGEDTAAPGEVTGLGAVAGLESVTLSWIEPVDVDYDHVVITHDRAGGTTPRIVLKGTLTVTVPNLSAMPHVFTLVSYDASGNDSEGVSTATVTPLAPDTAAPAEVTSLDSASGSYGATITWLDPTDNDFEGIVITEEGSAIAAIFVTDGSQQAVIQGLAGGTAYTFRVRSYDTVGNYSAGLTTAVNTLGADATAPAMVTDLQAAAGASLVTLAWLDPGDADLNYLEVTHDRTGGSARVVAKGHQTMTWGELENGTTYTFTVVSVDIVGNRSAGRTAACTPSVAQGDATVNITMNTPSDVSVTFSGTVLTLNKTIAQSMNVSTNRTAAQSYAWYLDGNLISGATNYLTNIGSASLTPGLHDVALVVQEAGLLYSAQFEFTVVNN